MNLLDIQEKLKKIWIEILEINDIDLDENFLVLGGNSLNLIALECEIGKEFGVEIALDEIFKNLTINMLSKLIQSNLLNDNEKVDIIEQSEDREYYPLSWTQKENFILEMLTDNDTAFNVTGACQLEGSVDVGKLEKSIQILVQRHEILRTVFKVQDDVPVQSILKDVDFNMEYHEINESELETFIKSFVRPFDISKDVPFRVALVKIEEEKHVLIMDAHHIVIDGYSVNIILSELIKIYEGIKLEPLKLQYKDYAVWQAEKLINTEKAKDINHFWEQQFKEKIELLNLPKDFESSDNKKYVGDLYKIKLDNKLNDGLKEYVQTTNVSTYNLILAAYSIMLSKYSGQSDILIGSISLGRNYPYLDECVGDFIKMLPIRFRVNEHSTVKEYVNYVQEIVLAAYDNQDFDFSQVFRDVKVDNNMDIYSTVVNYHLESKEINDLAFKDIRIKAVDKHGEINAKRDIQLEIDEDSSDNLILSFEFNKSKFKKETIERMAGYFIHVIEEIITKDTLKICDVKLLSKEEEKHIINDFNNTEVDYDKDVTIHEMFERQAEKTPDSIAVEYYERQMTYKELNEKANSLARKLLELGVKEDTIVGIKADRSIEMVIGLLGILKSGGAYLPIDTEYPTDRCKFMIEDSGIDILLTEQSFMEDLDVKEFAGNIVDLKDEELYKNDRTNLKVDYKTSSLAYIIYTSGTTGKPKGVMVEHRNVVAYLNAFCKEYNINNNDIILNQASYGFDTSIEELYSVLTVGGKIVIVSRSDVKDMIKLMKLIDQHKVTIISASPLLIYAINQMELSESVRLVISGGDILKKEYISNIVKNTEVYNTYGPTEATVCSTYYKCSKEYENNIPIGKPIANYLVYITNSKGEIQPIGLPGELCIGGAGVTRGYLNRPELTKEKFIDNPFKGEGKLYKTGDLARLMPDGNIEYLGRIDNQVEIRGYRVELEEVEQVILRQPEIKDVKIVYHDENNDQYICAYIVADSNVNIKQFKEVLYSKLPSYMVPQFIIQIEKFPTNINGKVEKSKLPDPKVKVLENSNKVAAGNKVEKRLIELFDEVLKVNIVSINDNLFDLGLDSLKLIITLPKIQKEFNVKLSIEDVFSNATIKEISEKISGHDENVYEEISKAEKKEYYPTSFVQKRLFVLNQLDSESTSYNIPISVKIKGELDIEKVQSTFNYLINRHEILRTTFKLKDNNIVQKVHEKMEIQIKYTEIPKKDFDFKEFQKNFIQPFDLENGPLIRGEIVKLSKDEYILQIDMHHIIADGQSVDVIIDEFGKVYSDIDLEDVKVQYKDFAVFQSKMENSDLVRTQKDYWMDMYKDSIPKLNMPLDHEKSKVPNFEGEKVAFNLDKELLQDINDICTETGTTMYMFLFASYAALLANYTRSEDFVIGVPILGRGHSDLERTVGVFVNTLAIRVKPEGDKTFKRFLYEVKKTLLDSYENQEFDLEKLIEMLKIDRTGNENPLFDTIFNYRTSTFNEISLDGMKIKYLKDNNKVSKFDFYLDVLKDKESINFEIIYCKSLFEKETMERFSEYYLKVLRAVTENIDGKLNEIELEECVDEEVQLEDIDFNF